jgi:tRNA (cytidine/uridine-2'-O-)-methyltransferase
MLHIALYEPEIPPNTGNIIRLCSNTGMQLHLVHPLGFSMDDRQLKRAGLDYHEWASVTEHEDYAAFTHHVSPARIWAISTKGKRHYDEVQYRDGDVLLFGPETRGLPASILDSVPGETILRVPMQAGSRSLNLANAVAVVAFEAWRQQGFSGGT